MEPRIATLLDQSPYKRFTLDPSVLTTSSVATRHAEPPSSVDKSRLNRDSWAHNDQVENRNKPSSQSQSSAPIARVLNDPAYSSHIFQPTSCRQTPQHAAFRIRNDDSTLGTSTTSPDARRREENHSSIGLPMGDNPLIQLPKPPQVPRKTTKRPRIPPLLQGLHQPPPLPPKSRLFPPITSDRNGLVKDVGDRFGHGNAFSAGSPEELTTPRASPHKRDEAENHDIGRTKIAEGTKNELNELDSLITPKADQSQVTVSTVRAQSQGKVPRKRTRWSQKETEDLLTGVSRFGIGRWKQILNCADFQFQGRTAVDLKDRFRVCRPGEGLKARKVTASESRETSQINNSHQSSSEHRPILSVDKEDRTAAPEQRRVSEETDRQGSIAHDGMNKMEIHGPFLKSKRRARREFSDTDDKNLLEGFKRHGPVWHSMRDDIELGFGTRHPTDLRDRFRIRYPDLFAQAGYKLKPKEGRVINSRVKETKTKEAQVSLDPETIIGEMRRSSSNVDVQHRTEKQVAPTVVTTIPNLPSVATLMPVTATSQSDSTRPTFDLITDLTFDDDDDDDDRSPIVLNRNILQWADENSSSLPSTSAASTNIQATTHTASDVFYNPLTASDGLHINPLATLKLPSTAHWSYVNHSTAALPPSLPPPGPMKHSLPIHTDRAVGVGSNRTMGAVIGSSTAAVTAPSTAMSRTMSDMRTPNLPNIVFPYVPNASARNAVHNLPPPADILSSGQAGGSDGWVWIG